MPSFTIAEIAAALGGEAVGDAALSVSGAAAPGSAGPDRLAVALSPAFAKELGRARAALLWPGADWRGLRLEAAILAPAGRLTLAHLTAALAPDDAFAPGLHATALIDPSAEIGADVSAGPFAVIGPGVRIGAGSRIGAHASLGAAVTLGEGARIHAGARLQPRVSAGARLIVQPGAVIGADGFSFQTETPSNPERAKASGGAERLTPPDSERWVKTESLGSVVLGDDVEIGANSTVDAGTLKPTRIGDGTKLDNLVQVGHNCEIGRHSLLCGQTGIAGSVTIGDRVVLGGQTGVGDHHRIGDDVVTGAGTMILANVPSGSVLLGYPSQRMDRAIAAYKTLRRLTRDAAAPRVSNSGASD